AHVCDKIPELSFNEQTYFCKNGTMMVLMEASEGQKNEILFFQNSTISEKYVFVNDISNVASVERFDSFSSLKNDIVELLKIIGL
ncbi:MAG: hypothetical protein ABI041_15715, partial [Bdellovibrionia bacterium]